MRHAVVVAPPRFVLPQQGSVFAAPEPVGPLCVALSRGGYRVVLLRTTPELETDLERGLAGIGPNDELLVYIAGETTTHADAVSLRLSDEGSATLALRVVSDSILVREPSAVLFIVEACHDGADDDPLLAAEHVEAITRALDARARGYVALVGVRPASRAMAGAWPFTRHILYTLEEVRDEGGASPMSLVYERLRSGRESDAQVQSFAFVRGAGDFVVSTHDPAQAPVTSRAEVASTTSRPPPPESSARPASTPSPSSTRVSVPPPSMPALAPLLSLADGARERGAWEEALAGYKAALMLVTASDKAPLASLYARIGEVKRAQAKPREAELNFEKALAVDGSHRAALDALVEIATEGRDLKRAVDWRRKRLRTLEGAEARVTELLALARVQNDDVHDPRAAAETLEEARTLRAADPLVLEGLRAAYEKLHRWPRVVDVTSELAELAPTGPERGALRFAAADVALGRLRDEERGLGLLDRALEDDPCNDKALLALVAVRSGRNEWAALDAAYTSLIDRFAKLGDAERAWDACRKLGAIRRDKLRDVPGAIEAFTGATSCKPSDVDSRAMLADMHLARGDEGQAVAEFERVAHAAPTRASTYARLFALHTRAGRSDRAWLTGTVLEALGAADVDQQLAVDQFRGDGPIRPVRSLDDGAWDELVRAPGADDVIAEVLRSVGAAATAARVDELRDARKLAAPDPSRRQSATSTVSAVRSFQWAAQVLGVEAPALYVLDHVPGGIAAMQTLEASTALGPDVVRGVGTKDLAFLAGRHIAYYRREHQPLVHYPTLPELSALFLGAVKLVMPELPVPTHLGDAVARMRKGLAKHVNDTDKTRLRAAVARLDARDGGVDLAAWVRGVELTAQRAGLLLCGDLATALARMRTESRAIADLTLEQRRADLLGYCASDKHARARALLGVEARTNVAPPAATSTRQVG